MKLKTKRDIECYSVGFSDGIDWAINNIDRSERNQTPPEKLLNDMLKKLKEK